MCGGSVLLWPDWPNALGRSPLHPTSFSAIAPQVEILAIATSSHKFQCDRPSINFPEFSLEAIAPPIEMGCRRRGDRYFVSVIQLLDSAG